MIQSIQIFACLSRVLQCPRSKVQIADLQGGCHSWYHNESKRSLLLLEAQNLGFLIFIASTFVIKTVSSTDKKTNKQARHRDDKTFTFIWIFSSPSTRLKTGTSASRPFHSSQVIENWSFKMKTHFPKIHPKPLHTSNPLQAPPARLLTSPLPPCWLAGWQRVGGPPS